MTSQARLPIEEKHTGSSPGSGLGCCNTGWSATDHANLRMQMLHVRLNMGHILDIEAAQAGDMAHHMFEKRPKPRRPMETLVIKSYGEKTVEFIKHAQHVKTERRPGVLMAHHLSLPN